MPGTGDAPEAVTRSFPEHGTFMLDQLNIQRYYGAFCDVILRAQDFDFKAHKSVLAAGCPKLQTMLYGMQQGSGNMLELKEVTAAGLRYILDFLYTGQLKLEPAHAHEILSAAKHLEVRHVEKACYDYYKEVAQANNGTTVSQNNINSSCSYQQGSHGAPMHPACMYPQSTGLFPSGPPYLPQLQGHSSQQPHNANFDTNYIEDYMKIIASLQEDQLLPPTQSGSHVNTSSHGNPSHDGNVIPSSDNAQHRGQPSQVSPAKSRTGLPQGQGPRGQFSPEDVRKTLLSVLAHEKNGDSKHKPGVDGNPSTSLQKSPAKQDKSEDQNKDKDGGTKPVYEEQEKDKSLNNEKSGDKTNVKDGSAAAPDSECDDHVDGGGSSGIDSDDQPLKVALEKAEKESQEKPLRYRRRRRRKKSPVKLDSDRNDTGLSEDEDDYEPRPKKKKVPTATLR